MHEIFATGHEELELNRRSSCVVYFKDFSLFMEKILFYAISSHIFVMWILFKISGIFFFNHT
jgi:hypothetical protein